MAWHSEIMRFAEELSRISGYKVIDEQSVSSIVLLSRMERPIRLY
jgi:wyosine [tRNA(Phe)-imidazoG37] synthetase (radical SAM superfamily)